MFVSKLRFGVVVVLCFGLLAVPSTAQRLVAPPQEQNLKVSVQHSGLSASVVPGARNHHVPTPASFVPWFEAVLQLMGVVVAAVAAGFSAISARGAVAAANEMREARRDATKPRLSYRILDRSLKVAARTEKRGLFSAEVSGSETDLAGDGGSLLVPRIELRNFSSPALNVSAVLSFEPSIDDDLGFLREFLSLNDDDDLSLNGFGLRVGGEKTKYMIAARTKGEFFLPHIGSDVPTQIDLPFAVLPRYAISLVHAFGKAREDGKIVPDEYPVLQLCLSFMSVAGAYYEQKFQFIYELSSFSHGENPEIILNAKELPSDPMSEVL